MVDREARWRWVNRNGAGWMGARTGIATLFIGVGMLVSIGVFGDPPKGQPLARHGGTAIGITLRTCGSVTAAIAACGIVASGVVHSGCSQRTITTTEGTDVCSAACTYHTNAANPEDRDTAHCWCYSGPICAEWCERNPGVGSCPGEPEPDPPTVDECNETYNEGLSRRCRVYSAACTSLDPVSGGTYSVDLDCDGDLPTDDEDDDGDGVPDVSDSCPYGAAMHTDIDGDGCGSNDDLDDDGDGVPDVSDSCPVTLPGSGQIDPDGDGCWLDPPTADECSETYNEGLSRKCRVYSSACTGLDPVSGGTYSVDLDCDGDLPSDDEDDDGDGVPDVSDSCPNGAAMHTDIDGDGCGSNDDLDDDGDGVPDVSDSCPVTLPGSGQIDPDGDGCWTLDPCHGVTCGVNEACSDGNCECVTDHHDHDALACHADGSAHSCESGEHKHDHNTCHADHTCPDGEEVCNHDQCCPIGACQGVTCPTNASCSGGACSCNSCFEDTGTDGVLVCTALMCGVNEACVGGSCQCTGGYHEHDGRACHSTGTVHDACAGVTCPANASCSGGVCSCDSCYEDTGTDGVLVCTALMCGVNEACVGGSCQCTGGYHEHDGRACHSTGTVHDVCAGVTCPANASCSGGACFCNSCYEDTGTDGVLVCTALSCGANETCVGGSCGCVADHHDHDGLACHSSGTVHETVCGTDEIGTPPNCTSCGPNEVPNSAGTVCERCPPGQSEATRGQCEAGGTEGGDGHCTRRGAPGEETSCVAAGRVFTNGQCPRTTCPDNSTDNGDGVCDCDPGYVYKVPTGALYGSWRCTVRTAALCGAMADHDTCGEGGTWESGTATCDCDDGYEQSDDAQSCVCAADDTQSLGHQASVLHPNPQSLFDGVQVGFVNTSTGNLTFRRRDIVTRAQGPVVFARVYDSRIAANDDFGQGWRLALAEELYLDGDVVTYIDESGARQTFARDGTTWVANPPMPQHAATTIEFGSVDGNRVAVLADGDSMRTFRQADAEGKRYVVASARTAARELRFDYAGGRLAAVSHDGAALLRVERGAYGRVAMVRDDHGRSVRYYYDAGGRLETVRDLAGSDWDYRYRDDGLLAGAVDPEGRTYLAADYDAAERVVRASADGRLHAYDHGPDGTTVAAGTGEVHAFSRNAAGATTALKATTGVSWRLSLDAANRISTLTLPARTITYDYGGNGKVAATTVADAVSGTTRLHAYDYDAQERLVSVSGGGADATVTYAAGLVRIDDGGGVFEYEVDDRGQVSWVRRGAEPEIRVERNEAGDVVNISQGHGSVWFGRDDLGRIVEAAFADGSSARYFYDGLGSRRQTEYGDGRIVRYEHDTAGNLASVETIGRDGTIHLEPVPITSDLFERFTASSVETLDAEVAGAGTAVDFRAGGGTVALESAAVAANVVFTGGRVRGESQESERWASLDIGGEPSGKSEDAVITFVDDFQAARLDAATFAVPGLRDAETLVRVAETFVGHSATSHFDQPWTSATHPPEYAVTSAPVPDANPDQNSDCSCASLSIQSASIPGNQILVTLVGLGCTGDLQVRITGDGRTHNVATVTGAGPGTHTIDFGRDAIPEGQYDEVEATWNIREGLAPDDEYTYRFGALGTYTHSQYTKPIQAHPTCAVGGPSDVFVTQETLSNGNWITNCFDDEDDYTAAMFTEVFRREIQENGSGRSTAFGDVQLDWICSSATPRPDGAAFGNVVRDINAILPACAGGTLGSSTVAADPDNGDLSCGDTIYVSGIGTKTVTDHCPGCGDDKIDHYTADGRCSGIVHLGTQPTFRLDR